MNYSTRKDRFIRVSKKRLDRALSAIDSLENLSNKANYEYSCDEINKISGKLMARVKFVMASFGSTNAEDRYQRLIEQDLIQYELLKNTDLEVYELVSKQLENYNPLKAAYESNKQRKSNESELLEKFRDLYKELENKNKSESTQSQEEDFFILNPSFELNNLRATHNIDRLKWLKNGRQHKEIAAVDSPYRIHPDSNKRDPIKNLKWDINQGRVIQAPNNIKSYNTNKRENMYKDEDRFRLKDDALDRVQAPHNKARLEWIGEKPEGREFSEINDMYSVYRKNIIRGVFYGNDNSIEKDLNYDVQERKYLEYIPYDN